MYFLLMFVVFGCFWIIFLYFVSFKCICSEVLYTKAIFVLAVDEILEF